MTKTNEVESEAREIGYLAGLVVAHARAALEERLLEPGDDRRIDVALGKFAEGFGRGVAEMVFGPTPVVFDDEDLRMLDEVVEGNLPDNAIPWLFEFRKKVVAGTGR